MSKTRQLISWKEVMMVTVTAAALLISVSALAYAFLIATPNAEKADASRRMEQSYLDTLTQHIMRIENNLKMRPDAGK